MFRSRKARAALVGVVGLVTLDLGLSTLVIRDGQLRGRPLPPFDEITHPRQRDWLARLPERAAESILRFDALLGWTLRPDASNGDWCHVNSQGMRGVRDYAPGAPEGITRLACFGDSFTFGDEVDDSSCYPARYEDLFPDSEALNFGVAAYGTGQSLLRFRRDGRSWGAHVVCIGILLENIGRNVNRYRPLWYPSTGFVGIKPRFVLADGELELVPQPFATRKELFAAVSQGYAIELIAEREYWLGKPHLSGPARWSGLARILGGLEFYRRRQPRTLWTDPEGEPYRVTLALLESFHREALEAGARLAPVLVFPSATELRSYADGEEPYWRGFLDDLERRGVPAIDLAPALADMQREIDAGERKGSLYFREHLSRWGNWIVAQTLRAWIRANDPAGG